MTSRTSHPPSTPARTVVTIGNFDGVHRGHQALVASAVSHAQRLNCSATALTFDPHPATFFRGLEPERFRLFDNEERETLLRHYGIDDVLTMTFDKSLAELSPDEFVEQVLLEKLGASAVVVGWDFTYGKDRAGTVDTLRASGRKHGFEVDIIARQRVSETDAVYSSTALRDALKTGRIEKMNEMLGHHYFIAGESEDGAGRGGKVGIPTVNLYPSGRLLPPRGVYATRLLVGNDEYASISNLGVRPTFESDGRLSLETMILDPFDGRDLHHCHVHVSVLGFIRAERAFDGPESLRAQITRDVEQAKALHVRFPSDPIHLTAQTSSTSLP